VGQASLTVTDNDVAPTPAPTPRVSNLWLDYNTDNVDYSRLEVRIEPDQTEFYVFQEGRLSNKNFPDELAFNIKTNTPGYLVLIERGTSGRMNLIHPASGKVDDARVQGPTRIPAQDDMIFQLNEEGIERLRAVLFTSKERAALLLSHLQTGRGPLFADFEKRLSGVKTSVPNRTDFYTSDVIFTVLPRPTGSASGTKK
jgi:hypothetical protein